jgi:predicted RNA binding protein YcfA (HicA-like mRNA interferase family)
MKTSEFERILSSAGFVLSRITKHRIWARGTQRVAVPHHEINRMVARRVLKEIGYSGRVEQLNFG